MDTSSLDLTQRSLLADYWWQRAEGERTSWVGFGHVTKDLIALGVPAELVELSRRAEADEFQHSLWCEEWARRFEPDAREVAPRTEEPVHFRGATERENRILRVAFACFTETYGCVTLQKVRPRLVPPLWELNRRHMADEMIHARVGWAFLAGLAERDRECVRDWLDVLLAGYRQLFEEHDELEREDLVPYGYFSRAVLRAAHEEAAHCLIEPGLLRLDLKRKVRT